MRIVLIICDHYWRLSESVLYKCNLFSRSPQSEAKMYTNWSISTFSAVALAERTDHLFASSRKFIILSIASE